MMIILTNVSSSMSGCSGGMTTGCCFDSNILYLALN